MKKEKIFLGALVAVLSVMLVALVLLIPYAKDLTAQHPSTEPSVQATQGTEKPTQSPTDVPTDPPTEPPTDAPTDPPGPEIVQITISFTGDCTFGRNQKHTYERSFDEFYDTYGQDYNAKG